MKPVLTKHNQHLFNITPGALHDEAPQPQRLGKRAGDYAVDRLHHALTPWYESPEEIEQGLRAGKQKQDQLNLVANAMRDILTEEERVTMELRFSHELTLREIAAMMDRNASTIHRRIERCIRKLQRHLRVEG